MDRTELETGLRELAARCEAGGQVEVAAMLYSMLGALNSGRLGAMHSYIHLWSVAELAALYNQHGSRN